MSKKLNIRGLFGFFSLKVFVLCIILNLFLLDITLAQKEVRKLTLNEVIQIAKTQSPDAFSAKHLYKGSHWRYVTHKAEFRPSLNLTATLPDLNRSIDLITLPSGEDSFVARKLANSSAELSISQNIGFTGGRIFVNSDISRIDIFRDSSTSTSYLSSPIRIGFWQPIYSFNQLKWSKIIEPLRYSEAQKKYIQSLEDISLMVVNYFFDLALAQKNLEIAEINTKNSDTLFKISKGRYNLGKIAQNELLQMELTHLNSGAALNEARLDLEVKKFKLRSYLGFKGDVDIVITLPDELPDFEVDVSDAQNKASNNNPELIALERQLIEAEMNVAKAKVENRFNANLYASFGLAQSALDIKGAYNNPSDQQKVTIGIDVPIIDWGLGKGRYKMAVSKQEVTRISVEQARIDFKQDIYIKVMQFNMQDEQVSISLKAQIIAQSRYNVTKQRFLIGKIGVSDLNIALSDKDIAKRSYIFALRTYWQYYYLIRKRTLFDYEKMKILMMDFDDLIK